MEKSAIKERIERYWNGSADGYDGQFGHGIHNGQEKKLWQELLKRNLPVAPGAGILDVGCGTGFLSLLLAELGFRVTGIDFAEGMMSLARQKALERDLVIDFQRGDAESPTFAPGSFDAVISRHVVWTLPRPERALENWRSLLKPGGVVVVIDGQWTPRRARDHFVHWASAMVKRIKGSERHLAWKKEYLEKKSDLPFFGGADPETIIGLFGRKNFENVWRDDMADIVNYERENGPMEYRLAWNKNRRYLIGGQKTGGDI